MIHATSPSVLALARNAQVAEPGARPEPQRLNAHPRDRVELSSAALANIGSSDGEIRTDLVQRIRREIAAGEYLTEEKLDAVVDRLHRELFQ